jgi:hypothetical protein
MDNFELALWVIATVSYVFGFFTRDVLWLHYRSSGARDAVQDLKRRQKNEESQS